MNDLLRELAPISSEAWKQIDDEARRTLKLMLAARKLVDFTGPLGWSTSAVNSGRVDKLPTFGDASVETSLRRVQPLLEMRVPFELARDELESIARGANNPNLDPVRDAAHAAAIAEDRTIFHGCAQAGIRGITETSSSTALTISEDYAEYPALVAEALDALHSAGVSGRYAIALGPRCYTGLSKTTKGGFPVMAHVRRLLDGPMIWVPAVNGAVVMSLRGGDFELTVGQDFSIGYLDHSATAVQLYLQESFTFRVLSEESAIPLQYRNQ